MSALIPGPLGYVVVCRNSDGDWSNHWDGVVHPDARHGYLAYLDAVAAVNPEDVRLTKLIALMPQPSVPAPKAVSA